LDELCDVADADAQFDKVDGHVSRKRDIWFAGWRSSNKVEQIP
jgi:hypothetical protein